MNKVCLMGRLTIDPIVRYNNAGLAITRFNLAVKRPYNKNETDFINCVAFGKTAEFIDKHFIKGQLISIVGSIQTNQYDDSNGETHYTTNITISETYFAGYPRNTSNSQEVIGHEQQDFII